MSCRQGTTSYPAYNGVLSVVIYGIVIMRRLKCVLVDLKVKSGGSAPPQPAPPARGQASHQHTIRALHPR